ncbi:hemerythrin domain-containing protein [Catenulispora sp. NF23]|uniref:SRPBCC family protein n=1 Tax=Catenulispora pinistramenti TaxID=2705254 RepID=UPI001BAAB922|nr:SRPBCC family protein [Catenulispora pinistramenti]MBS2536158.1 hemerythrin domain-containing protein [Catenulispora pinistramenti]
MSDVTESVDVHVPISTAYNQWTQFESFPEFMDGVESISQTDDRHSHWVTNVGGARREFDAEITEQHPDERIAWKSTGGDTSHAGVVTFHRLGDEDTRVTVQLAWQPQGLVEKVGSIVGMDNHQIKADTARFKKFIEQRGTETGQWRGGTAAPGAQDTGAVQDVPNPSPTTESQDDIVDVLFRQHRDIMETFIRVQAAASEAKQRLFGELTDLLHTHESGEQQVVHPVTRTDTPDGHLVAMACIAEERQADQMIAELKKLGTDHPQFDIKLEKFQQAVLAHAAREEQDEFPLLSQLPAERRQAMADQLRTTQAARN